MKIGSYSVSTVEAERFRLDGGAMFGVVPKPLWSRQHEADERNRIRMVTRCLLVRGEGRVVLIDTGMGGGWSDKERDIYGIENTDRSIQSGLSAAGVKTEDVTDVVLSHLHFDHAGGAVTRRGGRLEPTFQNARYHVQEEQLAWALGPTQRDRRSYRPDTFLPLRDAGRLVLSHGKEEILPGIFVEPTTGHTIGHQVVRIGEGEGSVVYCGDLIPTAAHLPVAWVMGYDLYPLTTMKEKHDLLSLAATEGSVLVFEHDPDIQAARVELADSKFNLAETVTVNDPASEAS